MIFILEVLKGIGKTLLGIAFICTFALFLGAIVMLIEKSFTFGYKIIGTNLS